MNRCPGPFLDWGAFVSSLAAGLQTWTGLRPIRPAVRVGGAWQGESLIAALVLTGLSSQSLARSGALLLALASGK
ncbi:MAG TPA: hypothetical protein PKO15_18885 [Fibrobacteria bacterium]|nr:hypothetical protein [Fibrobacteria bacterium]